MFIQGHPSIFFSVVDCKVGLGHKSAGEGAAREDPTKLDAEDQEEEVDMARKVFMRLYTAAFKGGIIGRKIGWEPRTMTICILPIRKAAGTATKSTASSRTVVLAVRHGAAAASETRKVNASTAAGKGKSAPVVSLANPCARSAQIRGAVSGHQESLIH